MNVRRIIGQTVDTSRNVANVAAGVQNTLAVFRRPLPVSATATAPATASRVGATGYADIPSNGEGASSWRIGITVILALFGILLLFGKGRG